MAKGKTTKEVAEVTGYSLRWIRVIAKRYNNKGVAGVGDQRHHNSGAEPMLDEVQQAQLLQALETPVNESGLWNGRKVADWMSRVRLASSGSATRMGISQADGVPTTDTSPKLMCTRTPGSKRTGNKK